MRRPVYLSATLAGVIAVAACAPTGDETVERAFQDVNVIDETDLSDVMLTVADPNEAVAYFSRTIRENPDRIDIRRGLAVSYVRAKRYTEAAGAWKLVTEHPDTVPEDSVNRADSLIRSGDWATAETVLDTIPPTHETFGRYRLEAMVADSNEEWDRADSFYEIATGLTTTPANVLNNWGYSKLTRGDLRDAERLFGEAIRQDDTLFTAKNNLVLARGARGDYSLPVIPMTQIERAQLLHTMGLSAIKRGDVTTGKGLLRDAIDTHPQYFEPAVRALEALDNKTASG
ncbi:tetratricopeptide repeat protein [uncultured Roseobacter sp.]|uniref:tetratricopeptide repeat protein n=1 Tax=uncultured Roseobacter sp. TaxID=114847 RepID=UPI00262BA978|nr:tetratricopeptide repeat protein [uncultured Roseobacter sp.]